MEKKIEKQKSSYITTLAVLEQMLNEENDKERKGFYRDAVRDFSTRDALHTIIHLIKERA